MKLFIGIDASLKNNQCCVVDDKGKKIMQLSVSNNLPGAQELEKSIDQRACQLDVDGNLEELKVATEASSLYDFHILEFLSESEILARHNIKLYRFNPRLVKAFKPSLKLKDKTDPNDAYAIAEYLRFREDTAEEYRAKLDHLPLQRLTRFRCHLVNQLVRERNYFLNQLFLKFSAFGKEQPVSDTCGAPASAVI